MMYYFTAIAVIILYGTLKMRLTTTPPLLNDTARERRFISWEEEVCEILQPDDALAFLGCNATVEKLDYFASLRHANSRLTQPAKDNCNDLPRLIAEMQIITYGWRLPTRESKGGSDILPS